MSNSAIATMFDSISPKYDALNHLLSFNIDKTWRRKTSVFVAKSQPTAILDVATGTADLAIRMAKDIPSAIITGVDISEKMLEIGKQKIGKKQLDGRIHLVIADAAKLPFEDNCFDAVTSAFGVRNFEHLEQGLREMQRVANDNGMIAILEFSHPQKGLVRTPYRCYSKHILPIVGRTVSKHPSAYSYLPDSVEAFPDSEAFVKLLKAIGLIEVGMQRFSGGIATLYYGKVQKSTYHHNKKTSISV